MREQDDISETDFVAAFCAVSTVLAANLWSSGRTARNEVDPIGWTTNGGSRSRISELV
jgi:hypothetical protein